MGNSDTARKVHEKPNVYKKFEKYGLTLVAIVSAFVAMLLTTIYAIPFKAKDIAAVVPGEAVYTIYFSILCLFITIALFATTVYFVIKPVSENHLAFDTTIRELKEEHKYLSAIVNDFYASLLISWNNSAKYELNAQILLSITTDLKWAVEHIEQFIKDCRENGDHRYYYIVTERTDRIKQAETNFDLIQQKIASCPDVKDKIVVKFLRDIPDGGAVLSYAPSLPISADSALYLNTYEHNKEDKFTMLAISTRLWADKNSRLETFDFKISDKNIWEEFELWFKYCWKKLDGPLVPPLN